MLEGQLSYAKTSKVFNLAPRGVFQWLAESKRAAAAGEVDSMFFFKIDPDDADETPVWFHDAAWECVTASVEEIESAARVRARDGVWEDAKFQGRTVYKIDPDLEELGFEGAAAYMRDANNKPIPERVHQAPSNELVLGILASYSRRYRKTQAGGTTVNVGAGAGGVITVGVRPQIAAQPLPSVQIVDASEPAVFKEIADETEMAELLGEDAPDDKSDDAPESVAAPPRVIPAGFRAEYDRLVARGAIPETVIQTATPPEYQAAPDPLIRPTDNGRSPLTAEERALLSRLPGALNRRA